MMSELFDEQALSEQYDIAVKEEYRAEGRAEGEKRVCSKLSLNL